MPWGPGLIARLKTEIRLARLWPWIERSAVRRFVFAAVVGALAAALHWLIFPITQARVTFIFFIPAIVLTTTIAGRWPGALVAIFGIVNSAFMKPPGSIWEPNSAEQVALISSAVVSVLVILVGDYYRSLARRELSDLHELHELSATLASIRGLPDQLQLILSTFARIHGAQQGLITTCENGRDAFEIAASVGFDVDSLRALQAQSVSASPWAALQNARVVIEDVTHDGRFTPLRGRQFARQIHAIHSTPLIGRDGQTMGALTVFLPRARRPSDRE